MADDANGPRDQSNSPQVVGYSYTNTWCLECAPEGVTEGGCDVTTEAFYEKQGWGYGWCDICGKELKSHEHEWGSWERYGALTIPDDLPHMKHMEHPPYLRRGCKIEGCSAYEEHEFDESMVVAR